MNMCEQFCSDVTYRLWHTTQPRRRVQEIKEGHFSCQKRRIQKVISMPSQNDNGGQRGPWGGGAKPGSDLEDLVWQGQARVKQIMYVVRTFRTLGLAS
jgi:hypothetical protein